MSVGAARQSEEQAAAELGTNSTLSDARIRSTGEVVAVAPATWEPKGTFVVVTRERVDSADAQGQPAWRVALATAQRLPRGGWAVSSWEPQR